MNTDTHQGTAKIYQFPIRSRPTVSGQRAATGVAGGAVTHSICDTALDACWYHDDAVKQAVASIKP
jgi:hypothetical protein